MRMKYDKKCIAAFKEAEEYLKTLIAIFLIESLDECRDNPIRAEIAYWLYLNYSLVKAFFSRMIILTR